MTTASVSVTIPPTLAFLVSNFHSLVNIKLDSSNYLLWKAQVENVLDANGYLGYVDGTVVVPPTQIRNTTGNAGDMVPNPEFALYKLIDSQILSCLTASMSSITLSYVLGLRHCPQVWASLSSRYNSVSRSHIHELRSSLYNHTKTSTMENYIDGIKAFAQKLASAGNPLADEELVFHALHGLPPAFNGFKTGIRTRGETSLSFDELVTMLNGEELQLTSTSKHDQSTVLVASHVTPGASASHNSIAASTSQPSTSVQVQQPSATVQFQVPSQSQTFYPQQQFYPTQYREFSRGKGRGSRFPRNPCDICGRTNHATQYCYYRANFSPFDQSAGSQWKNSQTLGSYSGTPQNTSFGTPQYASVGTPGVIQSPSSSFQGQQSSFYGQPQYQGQGPPQHQGQFYFAPPQFQGVQFQGPRMTTQFSVPSGVFHGGLPSAPSVHTQAHFAGFTGCPPSVSASGNHVVPVILCVTSPVPPTGLSNGSAYSGMSNPEVNSGNQWYFDSGATNHVTHSLQNIDQPQMSTMSDEVVVGNGTQLQVAHTGQGQDYSSNSIPGAMHSGSLSTVELL